MTETLRHQIRCSECDQPMRWRGGRMWFEGDHSYEDQRYECQSACQTSATVTYRTFIPVDVARLREGA